MVYAKRGKSWALTERGSGALRRAARSLAIGPSSLTWEAGELVIRFDEITVPIPRRLRGTVRVRPRAFCSVEVPLDPRGMHHWSPAAASARVEVALDKPTTATWAGDAYMDCNWGDEPLERGFRSWHWSRAHLPDDTTLVFYEVARRDGSAAMIAKRIGPTGAIEDVGAPPAARLPNTKWRIARRTRADAGTTPKVLRTFEDGPFYARSLVTTQVAGADVRMMHESLSLDRFANPAVRLMLPFRMPRVRRWPGTSSPR